MDNPTVYSSEDNHHYETNMYINTFILICCMTSIYEIGWSFALINTNATSYAFVKKVKAVPNTNQFYITLDKPPCAKVISRDLFGL